MSNKSNSSSEDSVAQWIKWMRSIKTTRSMHEFEISDEVIFGHRRRPYSIMEKATIIKCYKDDEIGGL